ncbi:hypothetical protein AKJ16_DCAP18847 [Drosera capensis]
MLQEIVMQQQIYLQLAFSYPSQADKKEAKRRQALPNLLHTAVIFPESDPYEAMMKKSTQLLVL